MPLEAGTGGGGAAAVFVAAKLLGIGSMELLSPKSGFSSLRSAADVYIPPVLGASEARTLELCPFAKELNFRVRDAPTLLLLLE